MIVDCAVYADGRRRGGEVSLHDAFRASNDDGAFVWVGLHEPTEVEFAAVQREFGLHELAVEDAINAHQRPKLEVYGDSQFIVLKTARYVDADEVVEFGEILLFVGADFIVSVRHGEASSLAGVRDDIEARPEQLRHGPGAVLHAIVDHVVDGYAPAIDGLAVDIDQVEEEVFSAARTNSAPRIYNLKREVLEFIRAASPLVDPVRRLAAGHHSCVQGDVKAYFRDVKDHLMRVEEQLEGFSDLLTNVLQANLAQVTVQQNEDVRKISAVVAMLAVPTMIAGIYGMNFDHMPELGWELGYPLVLVLMASICFALYRYFRRVGWL